MWDVARWHEGWKVKNVRNGNFLWVNGKGSKCLSVCQDCYCNNIILSYQNSPCTNPRRAVLKFNDFLSKGKKKTENKRIRRNRGLCSGVTYLIFAMFLHKDLFLNNRMACLRIKQLLVTRSYLVNYHNCLKMDEIIWTTNIFKELKPNMYDFGPVYP